MISRDGDPVQRIVLAMPPEFRFEAGQYLLIEHPEGAIPLSIASSPRHLPALHLHYRSTPGMSEAARMDSLLDGSSTLTVTGPAGEVTLRKPLRGPLLMVAGGTGMAQIVALLDDLCGEASPPAATVLWCADSEADLYARSDLERLRWKGLEVHVRVDATRSRANAGMAWLRNEGGRFAGSDAQIVLAGSPAFVYAACDALEAAGVPKANVASDVFSYAPREGSGSGGSSRSA
ncbi:MAG: hypothetical protein RIB46_18955 [Pseudomonadales bacterium]